ncbi:hypothetical protein [Puia dinghuensis]|uniref:hypothetical protein n=1 Tax=Puia dinghuensis TaxID=1792502 RepID=UPI001E44A2F3|nr:hypothetical protein [Puia dinghuensis]
MNMTVTKKKNLAGKSRKKRIPPVVVVTNTILPAEETLFPEKLKKAQEILSRTKFMDEK